MDIGGQEVKIRDEPEIEIQEVDIEKQTLMRLMVMRKKSLPDPHKKSRRPYWGFVEMVTTNIDDLKEALKGEEYDTSTRGHRHTSPARALGEGIYRFLKHINPASDDVSEELGLELETEEYETTGEVEEAASCSDLLNIFWENDISPSSPIAPLLKGIWA